MRSITDPLVASGNYEGLLRQAADLRAPVDTFLDNLMVMVDDDEIRRNRLALLRQVDLVISPHFDLLAVEQA